MFYFFCLSKQIEDIICASAIVSSIAKKGYKCTLFVHEIPHFANSYTNIAFSTELPRALLRSRRSIHDDIIYDLSDQDLRYINVWPKQLRGSFVYDSVKESLLSLAKHIRSILKIRQRITIKNIVYASSYKPNHTRKKIASSGIIKVCLTRKTIDKFENENSLSTIFSSCSRATFYCCDYQGPSSANCISLNAPDFAAAITESSVIALSSIISILPYTSVIKKQKLLFLSDHDKELKLIKAEHVLLTNTGAQGMIRYLRTLY
ncbi:MAG: hypothetical protein H8E12_14325 [Rhodobacteraceae bacterium]|nr:hypothetical protein [Paracoccaceae bacterium]